MLPRPSLTWETTLHDIGATKEYHGQLVWFEWQFQQARSRMVLTSAGTATCLVMARAGSTAGLLRAGPTNWATMKATRPTRIRRLRMRCTRFVLPPAL
jgi:hypothetical protein